MADVDRCAMCGEIIPEGRQVCLHCEKKYSRTNNNCHGCKWLDEYQVNGNGYCCMVERSKTQTSKVRRPEMSRCELYQLGDWEIRYRFREEKEI